MSTKISEMENKENFPAQILNTTVNEFKDGDMLSYKKDAFSNNQVVIVRVQKNSKNSFKVVYYDETEKEQKAIVVPPNFMFKAPTDDVSRKLIERYRKYQIEHLSKELGFAASVGSDPEIFMENGKGELIPAFDFLGSKKKPNKCNQGISHGNNDLYWDGFQAEFTTFSGTCNSYHLDSIQMALKSLHALAKKHDKTATFSSKTVFDITPAQLKNSAPEHVAFGCNKSFNAYGMSGIEAPGHEVLYRSAGGHIHLGVGKKDEKVIKDCVKAMDAVLGVACVSLFAKYDDPRRRQMYGLAGEYRLPPHGLEYRVLSNAWMFHPILSNIVYDLARGAYSFGEKGFLKVWDATEEEIIQVINDCDVKKAKYILRKNEILLKKIINMKYGNDSKTSYAYSAIINGADHIVKDVRDIGKNWDITSGTEWRKHCDGKGKNVTETISLNGEKV